MGVFNVQRCKMGRFTANKIKNQMCKSIVVLPTYVVVRQTAAKIMWTARTSKSVQDMMENGDRHSELVYRCLKHIASDEAESCDYEFYTYEDGEYTDVELFDWHLLPNYSIGGGEIHTLIMRTIVSELKSVDLIGGYGTRICV